MSPRPALAAALLCACTTVSQAPAPGAPKAQQPAPLPGEQEKPKPAQAPPPAPATPAAPGERPLHEAGRNRLYVALSMLRKLGLRALIERDEAGYRLDPTIPLAIDPA